MSWLKPKLAERPQLPEPPVPQRAEVRRYPDGRTARKTGRTKQFNPRVRPDFLDRFARIREAMEEQTGETITQAYMLELLIATYERAAGGQVNPFGLSEEAMKGAELIADKMGWPLSQVVEDAVAARCRDLNLVKHGPRRES